MWLRANSMKGGQAVWASTRDPELGLLAAAADWPPSPARDASVRAAARSVDWMRFNRIVARHRMAGMAAHALTAAGVALPPGLADAARADLVGAMRTAAEAGRLVALFAAEAIGTVVLKGPPLAMAIYGTLAVRQIRDLDLLVAPAAFPRALALLRAQGYQFYGESSDAWLAPDRPMVLKDVELRHPATGTIVELHARPGENDALLSAAMLGPARQVPIAPGLSLPCPHGEPLLLYLMVHGFRHGWHRLKWLADVAAIVGSMDEPALAAFVAGARARGLGVVVASTLLVLESVMATALPTALLVRARASRRARACAALAVRRLGDERELGEQVALDLLTTATKLLASPHPRYIGREAARLLVDNGVVLRLGSSWPVLALSVLLRPVMLPARKLNRAWRTSRHRRTA